MVQLLNYRKNGDPFINYLSITPIHDSRGHVTHFVGIQSDISDLVKHKKAELAAKHEAAQVSVAAFAVPYCICHTQVTTGLCLMQLRRAQLSSFQSSCCT